MDVEAKDSETVCLQDASPNLPPRHILYLRTVPGLKDPWSLLLTFKVVRTVSISAWRTLINNLMNVLVTRLLPRHQSQPQL